MTRSSRAEAHLRQFLKFGLVGGSGTLVNMAIVVICKKIMDWTSSVEPTDPFVNLFGTVFHIRWYHVFMAIAFLIANTWNYQFNRMWTFRTALMPSWWRGFLPFLWTGIGAFFVSQFIATLLMNPTSPIALSNELFDGSSGLRTKIYWANAVSIVVAMPVNFLVNKVWAFRRPTSVVMEKAPQ